MIWRRASRSTAPGVADARNDPGPATYWRALLDEATLVRARQDARLARLEVAAGVVLAATGAIGVARLGAPRPVDYLDLILGLALALSLVSSVWVIWPRKRHTFSPEKVRKGLEKQSGSRDIEPLLAALYRDAQATNEKADKAMGRIYVQFRLALCGLAGATFMLIAPTLIALLLTTQGEP